MLVFTDRILAHYTRCQGQKVPSLNPTDAHGLTLGPNFEVKLPPTLVRLSITLINRYQVIESFISVTQS